MKAAGDYQKRINRKKMREEGLAALSVTALVEGIAQIVVASLQSRYGETLDLPWETLRLAVVALGTAVALGLLAGERDKDQFEGLDPALTALVKALRNAVMRRFANRI